jgi:hypothetical protein
MTTWKDFQGPDYGIATSDKWSKSSFGFMSHFVNPKDEKMYEDFQNWCKKNNIDQEDNLIKLLKDSKSTDEDFNNYMVENGITNELAQEFLFAIGRKEEEDNFFKSFDWSKTGTPVNDSIAKFESVNKIPEVMKPPPISEYDKYLAKKKIERGHDPKQIHSTSPLQDILDKIKKACDEKKYCYDECTNESIVIIFDSNDCGIQLNFYKDGYQYVIEGSCFQNNGFSFPNTFNELRAIVNAI